MTHITYEVVEHNGGWAYKLDDVFSETFDTYAEAFEAAKQAAERHMLSGSNETIEYEDKEGGWHEEMASGKDRPDTEVES